MPQAATEPAAGGLPAEAAELIGEHGIGPEGPGVVGKAGHGLPEATNDIGWDGAAVHGLHGELELGAEGQAQGLGGRRWRGDYFLR
jgi:hypothetical protein